LVAGASSKTTTEYAADVKPASITVGGLSALEDLRTRGCVPNQEWQPTLQILVKSYPDEPLANPEKLAGLLARAKELGFTSLGISVVLSASDSEQGSFDLAVDAVKKAAKSFNKAGCTVDSVHILGGLADSDSLSARGSSIEDYLDWVSQMRNELESAISNMQAGHQARFSIEAGQVLVGHVPILSVITNVKSSPSSDELEVFFVSTVYGDLAGHMYNKSDVRIQVLPPPEQDTPLTGKPVQVTLHDGCCDSVGSVWEISEQPRWKRFQVPSDIRGGCILAFNGRQLDNGGTDFNMIATRKVVLVDESSPHEPFFESPLQDEQGILLDAAKTFVESSDGKNVRDVIKQEIERLNSAKTDPNTRTSSKDYYENEQQERTNRGREAALEWLQRNDTTSDTVVFLDLHAYAKSVRNTSRYLREIRYDPTTDARKLIQSENLTVDEIKIPIKTFCSPLAMVAHHAAGLQHDAASAGEMKASKLVGMDPKGCIVSHPHKTPETLALMLDPEFTPGATTIDSPEELDRLIKANIPKDTVLYVRIKAHGKGVTTDLSLKFGARYSDKAGIDEATPLLKKAYQAGFSKLGVAFHVGTQCSDHRSYRASLKNCLQIAQKMLQSDPPIKVTNFNIGGGFADERNAMKNGTGGKLVLGLVSAEVHAFREKIEGLVGEKVHIIAEPGRVTCASAGLLISRIIEDHSSDSTELRLRIAMTQQGGLSGNVHDSQYFAAVPLRPHKSEMGMRALIVGNSNRLGEIFPSIADDRKHDFDCSLKAGDWLMFPEAGVAYGWNASGAADGIDRGVLVAFYQDDQGKFHFVECPWSNLEAMRNNAVRRWYHSQQH
jgi:diaminopimelate decarboxylase